MEVRKLAESLHPFERKVLPYVETCVTVRNISAECGLQEVEVMRGLQWLENKGAVKISTDEVDIVDLDVNGKRYAVEGLPERRFLDAVKDKELSLSAVAKIAKLGKDEVNACVGLLRKKDAITLKKGREIVVGITKDGKLLLKKPFLEEAFLKLDFPRDVKVLSDEERYALDSLKGRKGLIVVESRRIKRAVLTDLGKRLIKSAASDERIVDVLTPEILRSGAWKGKTFRRYDVKINVPKCYGGKLQPYRVFLDWVRGKLADLGFEEMSGPLVESDFWDMDALFMPQFHSARDIHDAYYVEGKAKDIPPLILKKVKAAHESGGDTGSSGWRYQFDVERTKNLLLRTQTTACSARVLASNPNVPGKYFAVARCFRYDVIDSTHLPDFTQVEGIVIGEELNFRHLIGLLKMFAKEFADTEEVRVVPGYFPFTEPSAELLARHPKLGWIELGGAGIFRPELVKPLLGRYVPVLAWGLGIDRIAMLKLGIDDIRQLFSHDLQFLRDARLV